MYVGNGEMVTLVLVFYDLQLKTILLICCFPQALHKLCIDNIFKPPVVGPFLAEFCFKKVCHII